MTKYCKNCAVTKENMKYASSTASNEIISFSAGYLIGYGENIGKCPFCNGDLTDLPISNEDFLFIREVSNCNKDFLQAMIKLAEENPIDYQLKMSQFKTQVEQQNATKEQQTNKPRCPKCGSTNITTGARGINFFWGPIGASKTVNRCANCGHTWKP